MAEKIFLPRWCELLIALRNAPENERYCEKLHRKTGITTRHLRSLVEELERLGIVEIPPCEGKIRIIRLTGNGVLLPNRGRLGGHQREVGPHPLEGEGRLFLHFGLAVEVREVSVSGDE